MMVLALLAAAAAEPAPPRIGPVVQASATVRIISGRRLTLGTPAADAELRKSSVRDIDGRSKPARLIEFQ